MTDEPSDQIAAGDEPAPLDDTPPADSGDQSVDQAAQDAAQSQDQQFTEPPPDENVPPPTDENGNPLPQFGPDPVDFTGAQTAEDGTVTLADGRVIPPNPDGTPNLPPGVNVGVPPDIQVQPPQIASGGGALPLPPNHDLPGLGGVLDWLHRALQQVQDTIGGITSQIHDTIGALIEGLVPPTVAAITGMAGIMGELVQGLLNNLAPVNDVGQMAQDALTGGIPLAIQGFIDQAWSDRGDAIPQLLEGIVNNDELPDNIKAIFSAIHQGTSPVEKVLGIFGLAGLIASVGHTILAPILDKASQGSNIAFRPAIPDLAIINSLFLRGLIDSQTYNGVAARLGYPDNWIDQIRDANFEEFPPEMLQEMRRRGLLDDEQYNAHWRNLGFSEAQSAALDQVRWTVPNYTDLVHFMTRDAFWDSDSSPFGNIVSDFQLNFGEDNLPFDKFAQAGVPEDMARFAWRAHWEIPGRHDANEMFFRGTLGDRGPGGDGERVLERVYRARGIEPRFIQPLIATAFRTLGRIDIRRLVKLGQLDRDSAIEAYQQIGYNPDNATLLADLAITLATSESAAEKEPFRSGLKGRIVAAYINATISEAEATDALTVLNYNPDSITQFITEAEVERHGQTASHIRQGVQRLYASGEWTKDIATQYLQSKGFGDTEIGRLFEWWEPLRDLSDLKAEHKLHKEATRGDILGAYTDDVIDANSARDHLSALGYNDDDISMFISRIDFHKTRTDITAQISGIQAAYEDRQIDTQTAIGELDSIGVNGTRRDALIRRWQATLDRHLPDLPLAMVEKLAVAKLYSFDELATELRNRHFRDDQISKFMALWGYEIEVAAQRAKTQSQREADAEQRRIVAEQRRKEAEQRRIDHENQAEVRRQQAEIRRAEADARRATSEARQAKIDSQREHDRLVRDARAGRLSVGRIRTAFTLGITSEEQSITLMEALGLRPETAQLEMNILNEQARTKKPSRSSSSGSSSVIASGTAPIGP